MNRIQDARANVEAARQNNQLAVRNVSRLSAELGRLKAHNDTFSSTWQTERERAENALSDATRALSGTERALDTAQRALAATLRERDTLRAKVEAISQRWGRTWEHLPELIATANRLAALADSAELPSDIINNLQALRAHLQYASDAKAAMLGMQHALAQEYS